MGQFRFETEVQVTTTIEYIIEADTLEEALEQLQTGEHRERGTILKELEDINWETEIITVEETLEK